MAIFTKFGTPVTIVSADMDEQEIVWCTVEFPDDPGRGTRGYAMHDLRATEGLSEIVAVPCVNRLFNSQNS
jgi:hypothetical protein